MSTTATAPQNTNTTNVITHFASIQEFKELLNINRAMQVVKNPHTGKLFVYHTDTQKFKCEAGIDLALPLAFIWTNDDVENACLINVKAQNNVVGSI